ncbi:methyltransferase [Undibacterium pigrum]|uniref:Glycosyl transferase family 1 n=1 Tax=Undibacterium pigrum TaxID=401470 RepID=A0A318JCJ0_9BURK|nr:methyltransferase [Undibacterium pigrum]PXX46631.1 glycosyl transferase family 1 [Undibacterium pigrum]
MQTEINSRAYWDTRFDNDWLACKGDKQSRFFARVAIQHLPSWLLDQIRQQEFSLADWGCAQGDGTDVWASYVVAEKITGVDFSASAIQQASARYPGLQFVNSNWLEQAVGTQDNFDLVFSSNTLEHFHQPYQVLHTISQRARKAVVLALPYRELERDSEHFYSFLPENIPLQLENGFSLIWAKVVDCRNLENSLWQGDQVILMYADTAWTKKLGLRLSQVHLMQQDTHSELHQLQEVLSKNQLLLQQSQQAQEKLALENTHQQDMLAQHEQFRLQQQQDHAGLLEKYETLQQDVQARDQQISILNEKFRNREHDLQTQLSDMQAQMSKEAEAQTQFLQAAQTDVAARDAKLQQLNASHQQLSESLQQKEQNYAKLLQQLDLRDAQMARLNLDVHGKEEAIKSLKQSFSWVLTRPLRFTKQFVQSPGRASYDLAKFVFWRLPAKMRWALHGPRHDFVRWVRTAPAGAAPQTFTAGAPVVADPFAGNAVLAKAANKDLSWPEFQQQVLSRRADYKGIFVQELVIDWNVPLYQRPQHIAAAFGRLGYLVIYRTDNWAGDDVQGCREVVKNVWITNRHEINQLQDVTRSLYSTAYANTPELLLENGKRGTLVYEYIDHIDPQISGDEENVRRLLALKDFAFNGGADYVVASAKKLEAEAIAAVGADKVILAQNGVDTAHYRHPKHLSTPLPQNLQNFRKKYNKVVGYFGALAPWLWYEAVADLVTSRPDLGFVFIGPDYYGGSEKLLKADNLLYMGTVDYQILPAYARQFDVCFIPFAPGEIARTTSPLKLFEYFALEKPVVVTRDMEECVAFEEVFSGNSVEALSDALDAAFVVKDDPAFTQRLAQLADANDWDCRARAMEKAFEKA